MNARVAAPAPAAVVAAGWAGRRAEVLAPGPRTAPPPRSGGVLLALLMLPLYIPVLIFGAGAVDNRAALDDHVEHAVIVPAT